MLTPSARRQGELTPVSDLVLSHLDLLVNGGADHMSDVLGIPLADITDSLVSIRRCNPKPGAAFIQDEGDIFRPDLIIRAQGSSFSVAINRDSLPEISIREDMPADDEAARILKAEALAQMRALTSALKTRSEMLLSAGAVIIQHQQAFLRGGELSLLPLTMAMVAEKMQCHKSTISRLVADKLCDTPRGMLSLRDFFSSALKQPRGADLASRAVAARVADLIAQESKTSPLSDQAIADHLGRNGISIARRTVAKYREQNHIKPWQYRLSEPR